MFLKNLEINMSVSALGFLLILAMAGYSDAAYCVCNSGLSDPVLQKNIDYACGNGADCTQIQQNGGCFSPNTVKNHCDYAVNSYYQRKGQVSGSCDFSGSATVTATNPSSGTCTYPSSPSNTGTPVSGTPVSGTPVSGTPVSGTPATGTPATGTPTTGTPISGTPATPTTGTPISGGGTSTGGSTFPGGNTSPPFGLGPTGSGFPSTDSSSGEKLVAHNVPFTLISISIILISSFVSRI